MQEQPNVIEQITELLAKKEGQIVTLKVTFASKKSQTVNLFYAEGRVGLMPRSKRQHSGEFKPREKIVAFSLAPAKRITT